MLLSWWLRRFLIRYVIAWLSLSVPPDWLRFRPGRSADPVCLWPLWQRKFRLAKLSLIFNGGLAKLGSASLVKATIYYGDVTWVSCHLNHRQLDCVFNNLFRTTIKENLRVTCPLAGEIPMDSPHKGPVMRHKHVMTSSLLISALDTSVHHPSLARYHSRLAATLMRHDRLWEQRHTLRYPLLGTAFQCAPICMLYGTRPWLHDRLWLTYCWWIERGGIGQNPILSWSLYHPSNGNKFAMNRTIMRSTFW